MDYPDYDEHESGLSEHDRRAIDILIDEGVAEIEAQELCDWLDRQIMTVWNRSIINYISKTESVVVVRSRFRKISRHADALREALPLAKGLDVVSRSLSASYATHSDAGDPTAGAVKWNAFITRLDEHLAMLSMLAVRGEDELERNGPRRGRPRQQQRDDLLSRWIEKLAPHLPRASVETRIDVATEVWKLYQPRSMRVSSDAAPKAYHRTQKKQSHGQK